MYTKNATLGKKIHEHLLLRGLEHPLKDNSKETYMDKSSIRDSMECILRHLGLDINSPDIKDTPKRVEKMYREELCYGLNYDNFPECTTTPNTKKVSERIYTGTIYNTVLGGKADQYASTTKVYDEMVCEKGITVHSLCEHHFVPFIGRASVAYIPDTHLLGLSKLNRVVDFFSRRPQVQERLTAQICVALRFILETDDVAVVVEAEHLCVKLRGIQHQDCSTVTSQLSGKFKTVDALRNEFLQLSKTSKR